MFGIGPMELFVILVIALVIFGPKKIPEIANALGRSINEFKKGAHELEASVRREIDQAGSTPPSQIPAPDEAKTPRNS